MRYLLTRFPWIFPVTQWGAITIMTVLVLLNAASDHGVQMALNCILLGMLIWGLMMGKMMDRRIKEIDRLFAEMKVTIAMASKAEDEFRTAIKEGQIEVIPVMPDLRPPTRH
jgi:hypothetical protein